MMEQYKYEPLYGLQKPFDNGPADSTAYGLFRDGDEYIYYKIDKTSVYCFDTDNQWSHIDGAPTIPFLAMRRIIPEPKRWTVEDQKAGRLPEVGCSVLFTHNNFKCEVIAIDDSVTEDVELALRFSDGSILVCKINKIKPIETPEEKAARLREEWCIKALRYNSQSGSKVEAIYDALLSGELPVPVKDGE